MDVDTSVVPKFGSVSSLSLMCCSVCDLNVAPPVFGITLSPAPLCYLEISRNFHPTFSPCTSVHKLILCLGCINIAQIVVVDK